MEVFPELQENKNSSARTEKTGSRVFILTIVAWFGAAKIRKYWQIANREVIRLFWNTDPDSYRDTEKTDFHG
jgi:hemolysin-activating ACP:hemolysin acyltransferase